MVIWQTIPATYDFCPFLGVDRDTAFWGNRYAE
jgi:hypothetical protein